jgi:hypothetical protein
MLAAVAAPVALELVEAVVSSPAAPRGIEEIPVAGTLDRALATV